MDELFALLGLALPDTATLFRLKVLVAGGLGGVAAGVLYMASGLDGAGWWGTLMAACGVALIVIPIRGLSRDAQQKEACRQADRRSQSEETPSQADYQE